jgi:hypothetical protein
MRSTWATGALISACLVLGGLPALAQDAPPSRPPVPAGSLDLGDRTLVLTTTTDLVELQDSTQTQDGDVLQARDLVWEYQHHATDSRLDGTLQLVISYDMRPDGSADMWGTQTLTNPSGTWEGPWTGMIARNGAVHYTLQNLTGTGEYEGLVWKSQTYFEAGPEYAEPDLSLSVSTGWIEPVD